MLPHLQKVVNLGHSVQFPFLCLTIQFQVVFCVCCTHFGVSACQNPVFGASKLLDNNLLAKSLNCSLWQPPSNNISAKGQTHLYSDNMWYNGEYVASHIGEVGVLWVRFFLLGQQIGYDRNPQSTADLYLVRVVIIDIWINLSPFLWCFRQRFQIQLGGGQ
jgi:hypothetical protein